MLIFCFFRTLLYKETRGIFVFCLVCYIDLQVRMTECEWMRLCWCNIELVCLYRIQGLLSGCLHLKRYCFKLIGLPMYSKFVSDSLASYTPSLHVSTLSWWGSDECGFMFCYLYRYRTVSREYQRLRVEFWVIFLLCFSLRLEFLLVRKRRTNRARLP